METGAAFPARHPSEVVRCRSDSGTFDYFTDAIVGKAKASRGDYTASEDDDFVDDLTHQLFRELLSFMIEDPGTITRAIRLTFIGKYIERIADHATNVAELVIYMVEGKIVRHITPPVSSENDLFPN